jgi:hypothetical protein
MGNSVGSAFVGGISFVMREVFDCFGDVTKWQ